MILNATRSGSERPVPSDVITYTCNKGFFPSGPNAANLAIECLSNGSYSRGANELAQCLPFGPFLYQIVFNDNFKLLFTCIQF